MKTNPYLAFSATVIGSGHVKRGRECQDVSFHLPRSGEQAPFALAVVADGHGAEECFRAARGAAIAVTCAGIAVADFYKVNKPKIPDEPPRKPARLSHDAFGKLLRDLARHIVARWHIGVEEDCGKNPFTPEELEQAGEKYRAEYAAGKRLYKAYGSTLIVCAAAAGYWFGIHIGDGRLTALYRDGGFDQPVPWDEKCFLNQTTSICDDDAAERARMYFSFDAEKPPPAAVFLCSDGVDDNYPVEDNERHLFRLYRTIGVTFAEDGFESTCGQIKELAGSFAAKGKGDDTSIAGIIDMEGIGQALPAWQEQIASETLSPPGSKHKEE